MAKKRNAAQRQRARMRQQQQRAAFASPDDSTGSAPVPRPVRRPASAGSHGSSTRWAPMIVGAVALIAVVMFVLFLNRSEEPSTDGGSAASIAKVTNVPASTLAQVGVPSDLPIPPRLPAGTPPVRSEGKPVVTYIGSEYCPFCAMERWPMVIALSRFGTFSNLSATTSGPPPEVYPNTPTLTFYGSSYTSDHLVFSSVELQTRTGETLDSMTAKQQRLFSTYDRQQYTGGNDRAIPFVMIGNLYVWAGASYDPNVITGLTFDEIAGLLADPSSEVAQEIDATANQITAMICQLTDNQPQSVCSAAYIQQAQADLQGQ